MVHPAIQLADPCSVRVWDCTHTELWMMVLEKAYAKYFGRCGCHTHMHDN